MTRRESRSEDSLRENSGRHMPDKILRYGVFPLLDIATACLRKYRFLCRLQWDHNEVQRWQDEKLRSLLLHSYSTVPYYQEKYDANGISPSSIRKCEDLAMLPIATKEDLKHDFPRRTVSFDVPRRRMRLCHTSGSTGQMFNFYDDNKSRGFVIGSRLLFESWMGLAIGDTTGRLTNRPATLRTRLIGELCIPMSRLEGDALAALTYIRSLGPTSLIGDVSVLGSLANAILRVNADAAMDLRGIATTAEFLSPTHREMIARAFSCPIFDRYGVAEVAGYVAQECHEHAGLHVNSGLAIVEVVKNGEICGPGETGRLLVTSLHNYAMPFIRYDTGDLATVGDECSCGRAFPILKRIEGRSPSFVMTGSLPVSWMKFHAVLMMMNISTIERFQFVQSRVGELVLLVAPKSALTELQIDELDKRLNLVHPLVRVNVEPVDSIVPAASGKLEPFKPLKSVPDNT